MRLLTIATVAVMTLLAASPARAELSLQIGELDPAAGPLPYLFDHENHIMTIDIHVLGWTGDPAAYVTTVQGCMFLWGADASRFTPRQAGYGSLLPSLANCTSDDMAAIVAPKQWALSLFHPASTTNAANYENTGRFGMTNDAYSASYEGPLLSSLPVGSVIMRFQWSWTGDEPFTEIIPVLGDWSLPPGSRPSIVQGMLTRLPLNIVNQGVAPLWPEDLTLQGGHADVTTPRNLGTLTNASIRITTGGINTLAAYGDSSVSMIGGYIGEATIFDGGSVDISGGTVTSSLTVFGDGSLSVSGGQHATLKAVGSVHATVSGGTITSLVCGQESRLVMLGGQVSSLKLSGNSQGRITGGVSKVYLFDAASLQASDCQTGMTLAATGDSRFSLADTVTAGTISVRDSAAGSISNCGTQGVSLYNNARLKISDSATGHVFVTDNSIFQATGGSPGSIGVTGLGLAQLDAVIVDSRFGIVASGHGRAEINNSSITGTGYAVMAGEDSLVTVRNSTLIGAPGVYARDNAHIVLISGNYARISATGNSTIDVSGGELTYASTSGYGTLILHGRDFVPGDGLAMTQFDLVDGVPQYQVTGKGLLSGVWYDGTPWTVTLYSSSSTGTFLAVPEPATFALLGAGLGGMLLTRRQQGRRPAPGRGSH